jgi:peptidoglycan hydrolase CwlO-like protein
MDVVTLLATIFGFVAIAGGAAGYFKASRGDSVIKLQEAEIQALRRRVSDAETDVAKCKAESLTKDGTIEELRKHNEYLQKLGQGSPQLKKLTTAIENQTKLINDLLRRQQ